MPIIAKKLTHIYLKGSSNEQVALKDIDLEINSGEFWGLIGHTGSGKSTLIQHFNALIQPTSGSVLVDGMDIGEKKNRAAARRLVGLVFQYPEYQLFEETVLKDIAYGPLNLGMDTDAAYARAREAMQLVGLDISRFESKSPFELSGGEKRRAAIAGAIAMRPRYLVLDEPMAGLDPVGRSTILDMLKTLRQETGCAIIMVSHSMDDIARSADRVAVLKRGELVMTGTVADVFSDPLKLQDMGLDIPQASALAQGLIDAGIEIDRPLYDIDQIKAFVFERMGVKQ